jgi:hypothetical protein
LLEIRHFPAIELFFAGFNGLLLAPTGSSWPALALTGRSWLELAPTGLR